MLEFFGLQGKGARLQQLGRRSNNEPLLDKNKAVLTPATPTASVRSGSQPQGLGSGWRGAGRGGPRPRAPTQSSPPLSRDVGMGPGSQYHPRVPSPFLYTPSHLLPHSPPHTSHHPLARGFVSFVKSNFGAVSSAIQAVIPPWHCF